jgi:hypothetical protein
VALVRLGFDRLWAHPLSSLALVTVRNPSLDRPSNCAVALGPWVLVTVRILVIISPAKRF